MADLFVEVFNGQKHIWHGGNTLGYNAALSRFPEHGLSIAVFCNGEHLPAASLVRRIATMYLPANVTTPALLPASSFQVDADAARRIVGTFDGEDDAEILSITASGADLKWNGTALIPVSANRFRRADCNCFVDVISADSIRFTGSGNRTWRYTRITGAVPTGAALEQLAGRYRSLELPASYDVGVDGGALVLSVVGASKTFRLSPVAGDVFQGGGLIVTFKRNAQHSGASFVIAARRLRLAVEKVAPDS